MIKKTNKNIFVFHRIKKNKIPTTLAEYLDRTITDNKPMTRAKQIKFIPKNYHLFMHPLFNDTENPFSFTGTVWITFTPTIDHLKTIELDADGLDIDVEQISVYRSHVLSLRDFPPSTFNQIYDSKRVKRDDSDYYDNPPEISIKIQTTTTPPQIYFTDIEDEDDDDESRFYMSNKYTNLDDNDIEIGSTNPVAESSERNETIIAVTDLTETSTSEINDEEFDDDSINTTTAGNTPYEHYFQNFFINETSEMKVVNVETNLAKMKIFVQLEKELVHDNIYIIRINFGGNMFKGQHGLSYAEYENSDGSQRYVMRHFLFEYLYLFAYRFFAATLTSPNYTSKIFPCFDDDSFLTPITASIVRPIHMNTISNAILDRSDMM